MSAYQDDMIAELQRANAVLRAERDAARAREAELDEAFATRNTQFDERLEHQTATIDVLKAMAASPGDPQPVFDAIVRNAALLCESRAGLRGFDGTHMRMLAYHGESPDRLRDSENSMQRRSTHIAINQQHAFARLRQRDREIARQRRLSVTRFRTGDEKDFCTLSLR